MVIVDVGQHMVIDPEIMHGSLTFKGTRVPVSMVLEFIEDGLSVDEVEREWPQVSREAAREAVRLATESLLLRYQAELDAADDEARRRWDAVFGTKKVEEKAQAQTSGRLESRIAGG
jgi:uncharacterized protein (DUF433 family)